SPIGLTKSGGSRDKAATPSKTDSLAASQDLNKIIRDQEDKVEERRKVLATIVRTKGIIYKGQDSFYGTNGVNEDQGAHSAMETRVDGTREETIKRGLDAQDYADAKRDFETDQEQLQQLKLKQIAETISNKKPPDSTSDAAGGEQTASFSASTSGQDASSGQRDLGRREMGEAKPAAAAVPASQMDLAVDSDKPRVVPSLPQGRASGNKQWSSGGVNQNGQALTEETDGLAAGQFADSENSPSAAPSDELPMEPAVELAKAKKALASGEIRGKSRVMSSSAASSNIDAILNNREGKDEMKSDHGAVARTWSYNSPGGAGGGKGAGGAGGGKGAGIPSLSQPTSESTRGGAAMESPNPASDIISNLTESETASRLPSASNESLGMDIADKSTLERDAKATRSAAQQMENKEEQSLSNLDRKSSETGAIASGDRTEVDLFSEVDKALEPSAPAAPERARLAEASDRPFKMAKAQPPAKSPLESIEEIAAVEEPYSTFSLNINDASFQIAKAALEKGNRPDPAGIKVEQFYNAVDYGDPAPASNEPVAATIEQAAHPIIPGRNLVRVSLKTAAAGRGASQPLRLTLLVDQSGSMVREDRRTAMTNALKQLGGLLTPNDHITVVGFSRESHLLADNWTGDKAGQLGDLINQTASEGGTNLEQAINLGEQMAARPHAAGEQNRIVLFTDGAANLGNANPERLAERVKSLRQKGIAFDIAGIGADGLNDRLLSELARNGNGRYYVVGDDKNDSFARQLAGAFRPAAENVKVQVHFNPDRVGRYKLIGFEKDRLKTEDFRNDTVDAAELAAEEAGVAIYQVETLPQGTGEIGEVSVRFRDTAKGEMVERTWTMPFESTTQVFDRATPSMQLAGLSMLAAEKLKGGPLADAIDFRQLSGSQSLVKQFYGSSPRVADMLHVIDLLK
ncbi:MAG: von Willebrand factor type A domain-containing protein, partial [Luteolibacter sp.]